jgi:type VI secretion system protein ImpE
LLVRLNAQFAEGRAVTANDSFKAGRLQEAIDAQLKAVKADPADHGKRIFLFELLAFAGDLDRAQKHLDLVEYGELELDQAVIGYRKLIEAEQARRRLFKEGAPPRFLTEAPEHVHWRLDALTCLREGRPADAMKRIEKAEETAPVVKGRLNDKPFELLRDYDDVLGTVLEVMARDAYYWVPLELVSSLTMNPPRYPRDLIWAAANLETKSGEAGDVFLPVVYASSHEHPNDQVKLGRITDWIGGDETPLQGVGARIFRSGDTDVPLLEWRRLEVQE